MKAELIVDAPIIDKKEIWVKKVYKPNFDHPFHFHKTCELTWMEKGHGKLIVGDFVGNYSEDELLFLAPELPHIARVDAEFHEQTKNKYIKAFAIYFPSVFVTEILDNKVCVNMYNNLLKRAERGLRLFGTTKTLIIALYKEIIQSDGFERLGYFLQIIHILCNTEEYELLANPGYQNPQSESELNRFSNVYNYLFENFYRDITLGEIANICNMSPSAFCRFFKSKTQRTFVRFLTEIRISHACKLLQNENYSIKNMCYECGFNNPVIFFKSFKSITAKTPREYRLHTLAMSL